MLKGTDYKWIFAGCIIPDLPWILQRVVKFAYPGIDPYDLRLYVIIQASFFFCLILSAAVAALSVNYWKIFAILGFNSFLHLLLDACQIKWANGVHFLAPFNWRLINFGFFWPESIPTYLLTVFGMGYLVWNWRRAVIIPLNLSCQPATRFFAFIVLMAVYLTLPCLFLGGSEEADNHFVKTLRARSDRPGQYIELDRSSYLHLQSGGAIRILAGEDLSVDGMKPDHSVSVSVKGRFITEDHISVSQYHEHSSWLRDGCSYAGLFLVSLLWISALVRQKVWALTRS